MLISSCRRLEGAWVVETTSRPHKVKGDPLALPRLPREFRWVGVAKTNIYETIKGRQYKSKVLQGEPPQRLVQQGPHAPNMMFRARDCAQGCPHRRCLAVSQTRSAPVLLVPVFVVVLRSHGHTPMQVRGPRATAGAFELVALGGTYGARLRGAPAARPSCVPARAARRPPAVPLRSGAPAPGPTPPAPSTAGWPATGGYLV